MIENHETNKNETKLSGHKRDKKQPMSIMCWRAGGFKFNVLAYQHSIFIIRTFQHS